MPDGKNSSFNNKSGKLVTEVDPQKWILISQKSEKQLKTTDKSLNPGPATTKPLGENTGGEVP